MVSAFGPPSIDPTDLKDVCIRTIFSLGISNELSWFNISFLVYNSFTNILLKKVYRVSMSYRIINFIENILSCSAIVVKDNFT